MSKIEEDFQSEWQQHFNEIVAKFDGSFLSLELSNTDNMRFGTGDASATDEELPELYKLVENRPVNLINISYSNIKYVFIKEIENNFSPMPFYLFLSKEEEQCGIKRGLVLTEYFGFVFIATFNNVKSHSFVRVFCNHVMSSLSQAEE